MDDGVAGQEQSDGQVETANSSADVEAGGGNVTNGNVTNGHVANGTNGEVNELSTAGRSAGGARRRPRRRRRGGSGSDSAAPDAAAS
jgi:hypothetical protein